MTRSPAQVFALVVGVTLVLAGVLGFFYEATFDSGDDARREAVLGILDVNGWHNLVHLATGVAGIVTASSFAGARIYAIALGVTYAVVATWGFLLEAEDVILGLVPVNTEDNVLHALIAAAAFLTVGASPSHPAPSTTATGS